MGQVNSGATTQAKPITAVGAPVAAAAAKRALSPPEVVQKKPSPITTAGAPVAAAANRALTPPIVVQKGRIIAAQAPVATAIKKASAQTQVVPNSSKNDISVNPAKVVTTQPIPLKPLSAIPPLAQPVKRRLNTNFSASFTKYLRQMGMENMGGRIGRVLQAVTPAAKPVPPKRLVDPKGDDSLTHLVVNLNQYGYDLSKDIGTSTLKMVTIADLIKIPYKEFYDSDSV